jgi:hypothetical protein
LIGVFWQPLVNLRWILTNLILVLLKDYPEVQLQTLLLASILFQALILLGKPMEGSFDNKVSLAIELAVSAYLYVMMMLTDFTGNNPFRETQGWILAGLITSVVGFNTVIVFAQKGHKAIRMIRAKLAQRKKSQTVAIRAL